MRLLSLLLLQVYMDGRGLGCTHDKTSYVIGKQSPSRLQWYSNVVMESIDEDNHHTKEESETEKRKLCDKERKKERKKESDERREVVFRR